MPKIKYISITTKFIMWFLFVALVPLIIATFISYNSSRSALKTEITNSLLAVAENKSNQIETFLSEKVRNVTTLSGMSDIIEAIERFSAVYNSGVDSESYKALDKELRPFLEYHQNLFGYDNLYLIRPNGDVVFSIKDKMSLKSLYEVALYKESELAKVFIKIKGGFIKKTEVSDFEYSNNRGIVFIAAPVSRGTEFIGVVAAEMDNKGVSGLVRDYTGLGRTGETILVSKIKDKGVFITPLRSDPDAAFKRSITIGSDEAPEIQKALLGEKGSGILVDYRNKEVLGVWKHLPTFRWGIVVKMDTDEVFASADNLRNTLLAVSFGLLVLVAIMAVAIARSVSNPIKKLTATSSTIAGGDLSARANINSKDEIEKLAQSFNIMTDSLVEAKASVEQKNEELEEQKDLLQKANKELDSFVYTASHDLRAPLRGIASFASFLKEDYDNKLDEEGKDYIKEIREGTSRMDKLIEDLLKLSRISRIKNPFEDTNIANLVNDAVKRIEFDIKENNVDLRIQKGLPTIKCDSIKISEVFLNLINNAIKFSSKNKNQRPKVEVGYIDDGDSHKFFIKDNGIGIDPKYHDQIFGIFKRLHTSEEYEGTGAGLSIVKRVIDDHNGNIWIKSEVEKGATFYFTIPKNLDKKKTKTKTKGLPEYKGEM